MVRRLRWEGITLEVSLEGRKVNVRCSEQAESGSSPEAEHS